METVLSRLDDLAMQRSWDEFAKLAGEAVRSLASDEGDLAVWLESFEDCASRAAVRALEQGSLDAAQQVLDALPAQSLEKVRCVLRALRAGDAELALALLVQTVGGGAAVDALLSWLCLAVAELLVNGDQEHLALAILAAGKSARGAKYSNDVDGALRVQHEWARAHGLRGTVSDWPALVRLCLRRRAAGADDARVFEACAARLGNLIDDEPDPELAAGVGDCAERELDRGVDSPMVFYSFALQALRTGREAEARDRLQKLEALYPNSATKFRRTLERAAEHPLADREALWTAAESRPFLEHPSGVFVDSLAAMSWAMARLDELPEPRWIIFDGQGRGGRNESIKSVEVRYRARTFDVPASVDMNWLVTLAAAEGGRVEQRGRLLTLPEAPPLARARVLDALFRSLGIKPHDGEDDYAVGAEWEE